MKRYLVQTFGCQMNVHDSHRIEEVLHDAGYAPTDEAELADLVLVNTCSVREKAEHKLMSLLGTLRPLKARRPDLLVAVAGCVAQQEGQRLLKKAKHVDLVLGPDNIPELPALLREVSGGAPPMARTVFDVEDPRFLQARPRARQVGAFVTTMKGCDERCTFCIVPHTRGPERYRPSDDIVDEVRRLVSGGVREITLLGQTVNSWYEPALADQKPRSKKVPSASRFPQLLRRICEEVPDLLRLRYTSPHPRHLTDELVAAHVDLPQLARHLHLPVQSGSDRVLRTMSRRYTREHYLSRVGTLKAACPDLTLSTDIIVGFPGETEEDFQKTLSLVREAGFVAAFCFKYSPRPFTPALALGDDVPDEIKDERLAALFEVVSAQQRRHLAGLLGTRAEVLVEGRGRRKQRRFTGRTERNEIVHFDVEPGIDPTGHRVAVEIARANEHSLEGVMIDPILPSMRVEERQRVGLPVVAGGVP